MRALLAAIAVTILASCASTPSDKVYDRKYNAYYATGRSDSDFVGAGAKAGESAKPKPGWYVRGHP